MKQVNYNLSTINYNQTMSRIKKRGLDYFPLNTDFMHDRLVRRIMKREGDGSFAILLGALSCIYADEGYYVCADELFYEDLSACLYEKTAADVKRILALAVEYGIFNAALFGKYAILTSAEIQRQYLFSTKRRKSSAIDTRYCLVDDSQSDDDAARLPPGECRLPMEACRPLPKVQHLSPKMRHRVHIAQQSIAHHNTAKKIPSSIVPPEPGELRARMCHPRRGNIFGK